VHRPPPRTCPLPDGRSLAYDDLGAATGPAVVYLHGTPDSRLARHPDDGIVADLGLRLLAVDRPGFGRSDPDPGGGLTALGRDLQVLLDHLGIERAGLLGWSAGGLAALAAATSLGERVTAVVLAGTVPPFEAHRDPAVLEALGAPRRGFVELAVEVLAEGMAPAELAEEVAAHLVPDPLDPDLARDHVLESAGEAGRRELAGVPGAVEQLVDALLEAVSGGRAGLAHDVARQLESGLDPAAVRAPVLTVHGSHDTVSPPAVGAWLARHLVGVAVEVEIDPDAGHQVLLTRWAELVRRAAGQQTGGV
jgi:pimeloyl-ACP methyl ester carboxylesterase